MLKVKETWDLHRLYEGIGESEKLQARLHNTKKQTTLISEHIKSMDIENTDVDQLVNIMNDIQTVMSEAFEVNEFLICATAANVKDTKAQKLYDESEELNAKIEALLVDFDQLLTKVPKEAMKELNNHEDVKTYLFYLEERKEKVGSRLPLEMEKLIASLSVNGIKAWENHYDLMIDELRIPFEKDGKLEELSVAQASALFSDDRAQNKKLAKAFRKVCAENADTFASVLNRIAGFRLDVYKQRGWSNQLHEMLEQNRIQEKSLQAMMAAIHGNRSMVQQFLARKAQLLNTPKLGWYDLLTPTFKSDRKIKYEEAVEIVTSQFGRFHEKVGSFAKHAFQQQWIDAENRPNKAPGGFCAYMPLAKESRIFLTFGGNYQDVVTIAHELGHAYHNDVMKDEAFFAQQKGTSVAETASTFMENMVLDAAIAHAKDDQEKLSLLESKITYGILYLSLVPFMFEFEQQFYNKRKEGMLSAEELSELMDQHFHDLFGDIIEEKDTYRWITQGHFYNAEKAFYNIPYTIGYMFSNGVYALAKEQGEGFLEQYDDLLRNTGRMTVEQLAERYLNEDISNIDFWEASVQPVKAAIDEYLRLTEKRLH